MATKTKPLFDKPMPELREAFVRARFGQEDVFGMHDVEEWLQRQRAQDHPDKLGWQPVLARDFIEMCVATMPLFHLQDRATRYTPFQQGTERSVAPFGRILPLLKDGFYWGYRDVGVYVHDPIKELFVLSETHGRLTIERIGDSNLHVGAKAVVDVLFAEWARQRPKWGEAREFLCDVLAEDIKRERAKAERDFDTAVAVSADGTKIVHADYVVVIVEHGRRCRELIAYPATTFTERKLIRSSRMQRTTPFKLVSDKTGGDDDLTAISKSLGYQNDWPCDEWRRRLGDIVPFTSISIQELRGYRQGGEHRILLTTPNLCPSPLPDGGVEVMV